MRETGKISANQLFTIAFLMRIVIAITIDSRLVGGNNLLDLAVSGVLFLVLNLILILPTWFLHKKYPDLDIIDAAQFGLGKLGIAVAIVYALYLLLMNGYSLSFFQLFMENEVNPQTPVWMISAAILITACYGAFLGLEAIARTGGFIFLAVCAGMLFLLVSLLPEIKGENFVPLLYNGPELTFQGVLLLLSRSAFYCVIPLLLPHTTGTMRFKYLIWNVSLSLFFIVMLLVVCGSLGPMASLGIFPVYTAAALAQAGPFQRLDAVYIGIWMMGLFLTLSLDLYLISFSIQKVFGKKAGKICMLSGAVLLVFASNAILLTTEMQRMLFRVEVILPFTVLAGILLPGIVLIAANRKEARNQRETDHRKEIRNGK